MALIAGLRCGQWAASPAFNPAADQPGRLTFFGADTADVFTREVDESFKGALSSDYVCKGNGEFPAGFLNASPPGQPWYGTMWTRDSGTFLRELVFWGYYKHACYVAQCIMDYVGTNRDGFIAFPRYIDPQQGRLSGSEMDGQAATIIALVALWQRLPAEDPFRARLYSFLDQRSSPVRGIHFLLRRGPLVPGSGEFGGGKGHEDYNVVQNNLCALALISAANLEDQAGNHATANEWRKDARTLFHHIDKYLVNKRGAWIWGIDTATLKPGRIDEDSAANSGDGGLNGVVCMSADVLGFDPAAWPWKGAMVHGKKTFVDLSNVPLRKEQFKKYGIWTQMNSMHRGLLTSPSYGQGYALQDMLLFDNTAMAGHGLDFLAQATYKSPDIIFSFRKENYGRLSPYYFYERMYSPEAKGQIAMTAGCGPLNLVNVAEPLKVARLIAGVDDTSLKEVRIIPRLPPTWTGYYMHDWPICTGHGVVRADIACEKRAGAINFVLQVAEGGVIPKLDVRLSGQRGAVLKHKKNVRDLKMSEAF